MENWTIVDDTKIRHIWRCVDCDSEVGVSPWWYQDTGTPVCEHCGEDMRYLTTEINHA